MTVGGDHAPRADRGGVGTTAGGRHPRPPHPRRRLAAGNDGQHGRKGRGCWAGNIPPVAAGCSRTRWGASSAHRTAGAARPRGTRGWPAGSRSGPLRAPSRAQAPRWKGVGRHACHRRPGWVGGGGGGAHMPAHTHTHARTHAHAHTFPPTHPPRPLTHLANVRVERRVAALGFFLPVDGRRGLALGGAGCGGGGGGGSGGAGRSSGFVPK